MAAAREARRCPVCDRITELALCPDDRMATLLVDAPTVDARSVKAGDVIGGRYVVLREIGRGGLGCVFAARHTGTGQEVALKVISHVGDSDDIAIRRFFQEAHVTSGLRHPNTIRVFDFGQDDSGLLYIAMELLIGRTLKQELKKRIAEKRLFSEQDATRIALGVLKSLIEAHAAGLVHRDLKPDNIFLVDLDDEEPLVKVLDFGIVKLADSTLTMGSDSGTPGTPAYMSPEQVSRKEIDGRADLYSLGVILYALVTGRPPFHGGGVAEVLYRHVHEAPADLHGVAEGRVSLAFASAVHSCLAKNRDRRPKDARELKRMFEGGTAPTIRDDPSEIRTFSAIPEIDASRSEVESTRPVSRVEALPTPPRTGLWIGLAATVVLALAVGGLVGVRLTERDLDPLVVIEPPPPPPVETAPPPPPPVVVPPPVLAPPPPPPVVVPPPVRPPPPPPRVVPAERKRPKASEDTDVLYEKI